MRCIVLFSHNLNSAAQLMKSCPQMALPPELIRGDAAFVLALVRARDGTQAHGWKRQWWAKAIRRSLKRTSPVGKSRPNQPYSNFGLYVIAF
jgi:hypothetical protein